MDWPISPEGQRQFLSDLINLVRETPAGRGVGVVYWHPESVPRTGADGRAWNGGAMALFDRQGNVLPAIDALECLATR
jgi:arabinogalactan endo-1,4-beta-galactosidase